MAAATNIKRLKWLNLKKKKKKKQSIFLPLRNCKPHCGWLALPRTFAMSLLRKAGLMHTLS
jgi:hypothetical protein